MMTVPMRFLAVSVFGLGLDIGLSWGLAAGFGLRLWLAGAIGFAAAALMNYALHQAWTFDDAKGQRPALRFGRYLVSLGVTAAVRLGAIVGLEQGLGTDRGALAILLPSIAISFCASFLLARFWVFPSASRQMSRP